MKRVTNDVAKLKSVRGKVIFIIFILGLIISMIAIKNFLTIRNIEVIIVNSENNTEQLNSKITKESILKLCNLKVGDKLYKKLRSEISDEIEKNPYVEEAKISRNLSGKLKITVTRKNSKIYNQLFR